MTGEEAVQRINQGLGFRVAGNNLEPTILAMLKEAQRELEKGKTLPRFLLQEDQTLSLLSGAHTVALPTGFLRDSDETRIRFFPQNSTAPRFLSRRYYIDAVEATNRAIEGSSETEEPTFPSVYVIRRATIDFITTADANYTLYWDYYKGADEVTLVGENAWLENSPEWLLGEAGYRMAMDLRDADAVVKFDKIRTAGRLATFADDIAFELSSQPLQMGGSL